MMNSLVYCAMRKKIVSNSRKGTNTSYLSNLPEFGILKLMMLCQPGAAFKGYEDSL